MERLKKDIKGNFIGVLAAVLVCVVLDRIFGTCCPSRIVFGLPCPACGTLHSIEALFRMDIRSALWYQPMMPFIAAYFIYFCFLRYRKGTYPTKAFKNITVLLILTAISVYLYRMYKYFPDRAPLEYTKNNLFYKLFFKYFNF